MRYDIDYGIQTLYPKFGTWALPMTIRRVPIVPGCDPRVAYGDLYARGVRGIVLEAFGLGNMPDTSQAGEEDHCLTLILHFDGYM